jgi:hypothetical protein
MKQIKTESIPELEQFLNYYTPNREDFYEGYIYEEETYDENTDTWTGTWIKHTFDIRSGLGHDSNCALNEGHIRVRFLNKEDIESLGYKYHEDSFARNWAETHGKEWAPTHLWFVHPSGFNLNFYNMGRVEITDDTKDSMFPIIVFSGTVKSINELKTILRWLNLKW